MALIQAYPSAELKCSFSSLRLSDERIVPGEMKTQEWLLPERTASFNDLLLQYNGFCGYTLVNRDGLLLPGTVLIINQYDIKRDIWMFLLCQIQKPQQALNKSDFMECHLASSECHLKVESGCHYTSACTQLPF